MDDIEYGYTSPGAARIRTTMAGAPTPPPIPTSSISGPSEYPMPDMSAMMRWAAQQRAQREDAAAAARAGAEDQAARREEGDAAFARKLALRQMDMRERAQRAAEEEENAPVPYFVRPITGAVGMQGGYVKAQAGEPGAIAGGYLPAALARRRG